MEKLPRGMLLRHGRYYARKVIPERLRRTMGLSELRECLGGDLREAKRALPAALARFTLRLAEASKHPPRAAVATDTLTPEMRADIARTLYREALAKDEEQRLRQARLPDFDLEADRQRRSSAVRQVTAAVGNMRLGGVRKTTDKLISRYGLLISPDSPEHDQLSMAVLRASAEIFKRLEERSSGNYGGQPSDPIVMEPPATAPKDAPAPNKATTASGETLSSVVGIFLSTREIRPETKKEYQVAARMFDGCLDSPLVHTITKSDVRQYRDLLVRCPANHTQRFPGRSIREAISENEKRAVPYRTLNPATINDKWLTHIHALLSWCCNEGLIEENPATGVRVDRGKGATSRSRTAFTEEELIRIFNSSISAPDFGDRYWALLTALYTGARATELAQLFLLDLKQEGEIWFFDISDDEHESGETRRLKTARSRRRVPLHPALIELGFLQRHSELKAKGAARLFPSWKKSAAGQYASTLPRWFNRTHLAAVGLTSSTLTFHSFRHTLKTAMARAAVSRDRSDAITGHADGSVGGRYIHDGITLPILQEALAQVRFAKLEAHLRAMFPRAPSQPQPPSLLVSEVLDGGASR